MKCKKFGKLIKLLNDNIFNWSDDDFKYVLLNTIGNNAFRIFHYMKVVCPYDKWKLLDEDIDYIEHEALESICENGNVDMLNYVVQMEDYISIIYDICRYGFLENFKKFLMEKYYINNCNFNILEIACSWNNKCIIEYMTLYSTINKLSRNKYTLNPISRNDSMLEYLFSIQLHELYPNIYFKAINNYDKTYKEHNMYISYNDRVNVLLKLSEKYPILHPKYFLLKISNDIQEVTNQKIDGLYEIQ